MRILVDNNVHTQTTCSIMMMASLPKNLEILLSSLTESLSWFPFFHPTKHKNKEKIKGKKTKVEPSQKSYFFLFSLSKFVLFLSSLQLSSSLFFFFFVKQRQTTEGLLICLVQPLQEAWNYTFPIQSKKQISWGVSHIAPLLIQAQSTTSYVAKHLFIHFLISLSNKGQQHYWW